MTVKDEKRKQVVLALTNKEASALKERIVEEKTKLLNLGQSDLQQLPDDRYDEADMASADYSQSQILRMKNRELFYIKKLDRALEKMEQGDYGLCEDCGASIKFQRLLARPTAELCIDCKEEAERDENASMISRESKSMGETIKNNQLT